MLSFSKYGKQRCLISKSSWKPFFWVQFHSKSFGNNHLPGQACWLSPNFYFFFFSFDFRSLFDPLKTVFFSPKRAAVDEFLENLLLSWLIGSKQLLSSAAGGQGNSFRENSHIWVLVSLLYRFLSQLLLIT